MKNDLQVRLGLVLKAERLKLGFSRSDVADRMNVTPSMISMIEHGSRGATLKNVTRYVEALGTDKRLWKVIKEAEEGPSAETRAKDALRGIRRLQKLQT